MVVVGGGVAGLYAALSAAAEAEVLLLAKGPVAASNSWYAQGGVAAALAEEDEPEVGGRELAAHGAAIRLAQRLELLDVRKLADVDLRRQVPADRLLERLVGRQFSARE